MRTIGIKFLIIVLMISSNSLAQNNEKKKLDYKPKTLDEAIIQLDLIIPDSSKHQIKEMSENEFRGRSHFSMGLWIRNDWGLWKKQKLAKHFNNLGIYHPDDMSGIILTCYYRHLNNQEYKLDEQIKYYQEYWRKAKEHDYKMKTDTAYARKVKKESKEAWRKMQEEKNKDN